MPNINEGPLVSTAWLAERLGDPGIKVLDASWYLPDQNRDAAAEYLDAHISGAVPFDLDAVSDPDAPHPHTLPSAAHFAEAVAALGITNESLVVVYDGMGFFSAPRAWWMFRVFGHDRVAVLDGGFPKWAREGRPVETGRSMSAPAARPFRATFRPELVRSLADVRGNLETRAALILDARGPGRFAGTEPEPRPGVRPGHIPGSRNLHYARFTDPDSGAFLEAGELEALFASAGVAGDRAVICSCGSGVTACVLALGLHLLGRGDVAVYDGSWTEWGSHPDTPAETGHAESG